MNSTITFLWTDAEQVPHEGDDSVTYTLFIQVTEGGNPFALLSYTNIDTTCDANIFSILDSLEVSEDDNHHKSAELKWYVDAIDQDSAVTHADNSEFYIDIDLAVDDQIGSGVPENYYLAPNFPNPFNATTTIQFGLPQPVSVNVTVWDIFGRKIATLVSGNYSVGNYKVVWNADHVSAGVYFARIEAKEFIAVRKNNPY